MFKPSQLVAGLTLFLVAGAVFLRGNHGHHTAFTSLDGNNSSAVSHPENVLSVVTLTATDDDNKSLTYSISGGTDSALFEINATTNALQFIAHPDYEYPHDSNGDNAYLVTVIVSDGNLTDAQDVTVNVTDANDTYWTFTNAGVTGRLGPTQSQVNSVYAGTTLEGKVTINTQGIQEWTVPESAIFTIEARGASEGWDRGLGGYGKGTFNLTSGDLISIAVGQQGTKGNGNGNWHASGGGGGTFVVESNITPLVVSGGGGGSSASSGVVTAGGGNGGTLATQTTGGLSTGTANGGSGGAGFTGDGSAPSTGSSNYARSYANGAVGGMESSNGQADGGFGGGGSGGGNPGGGGGGYKGGDYGNSGVEGSGYNRGGIGGGSYNSGSSQLNVAGYNTGHGLVVITFLESTNLAPTDLSLSSSSVAENSSVGVTVGIFSATDPNDNGSSVYSYSLIDGNGSTDNASLTLEANGTLKTAAVFDYETKASYAVRVSVADEHNATYEEAFTISVTDLDDTAPVITLLGNATVTHEASVAYSDAGATWTDGVDGNGTAVLSGSVNVSVPGVYTLTYSKSDVAGNAATQVTRTVTVQDSTIPVITLSGSSSVTHEAATAYSDAGATWADTLDGSGSASANGSVNANVLGVYVLAYSKSDVAGNVATQVTRTVTVEDTTIPVITLFGSSAVTHEAANAYSDAGATWTDTLDGNGSVSANGSVNVNVPGVYILTYSKSDAAGNVAAQVTRTVTVQDTTLPVITLNGESNASHEAGAPYLELGAIWTDALDGNGSASVSGSMDANLTGVYLLNYSHTDLAGNSAEEVTRSITVFNLSPLGVELSGLSLEEGLSSATAIGSFSVPVNQDSNVSKSHTFALVGGSGSEGNANFSIDQAGRLLSGLSFDYESQVSFSIRVRATDLFGGEAEETFAISVADAFEPIVDTQPIDGVNAGAPTLRGVVTDVGHSGGILAHGFLLGTSPDLKLGNPAVSNLSATSDGTSFSVAAPELIAGKTYYYKAYATNVEGTGYGAQERFTAAEQASGPSWAGAVASPDAADWWTSPWFGSFFLSSNGWLRHETLGWLFAIDEGAGGVWFWQENLGWLWTGEGIYPHLFLNAENGWGFLLGDTEKRLFIYRFSDSTWLDLAEGAEQK